MEVYRAFLLEFLMSKKCTSFFIGALCLFLLTPCLGCLNILQPLMVVCRDSADTQYMLIQTNFSKYSKQLTYKTL